MRWEILEEKLAAADKANSKTKWLKLGDGDKAQVVFLGEFEAEEKVFGEGPEAKVSTRYSVNVAHLETKEVQIFEMGANLLKQILKARNKYGLENWAFELERTGLKLETKWALLPERKLTEAEKLEFAGLPLHALAEDRGAKVPF